MEIVLSKENQIILQEVKEILLKIKQEFIELSLSTLIYIKDFLIQFILSYEEYSIANIKALGLGEILMRRSLRFFKLITHDEEQDGMNEKETNKKPKKRKFSYYVVKGVKLILYPFYLILLILAEIRLALRKNKELKQVKNVKNILIE